LSDEQHERAKRLKMQLALSDYQQQQQQREPRWPARTVTAEDTALLATLMYDAYHGTVDDEGETPEMVTAEMQSLLAGKYGAFLPGNSFVIEEQGRALSATIVTLWEGAPLLAVAMTHPTAKNQGMAAELIGRSVRALAENGYADLILFVTDGNAPAQHLYERLGFVVED
jgi:GNAT superfamily N-acetyltransferase